MKMVALTVIGYLTVLMSGSSFAGCSTCTNYQSSNEVGSCGYISCRSGSGCPTANDCDCTDPYCTSVDNTCLTCSSCCDAFGNIGAR